MKTVLTIAGFDPSGGAGVLADIKTIGALGCFGLAAITSLTSQNTIGVFSTYHQAAAILRAQIKPLLEDFEVAALKIGMLPTSELVEVVLEQLGQFPMKNIVLDPVLQSSSGYSLMTNDAKRLLIDALLPLADVVTPNLTEAGYLLGKTVHTVAEMKAAAQTLSNQFSSRKTVAVLVKGGHLENEVTDVLFDGAEFHECKGVRVSSRHTHGTGCTLSSAIAAFLAQDHPLVPAVKQAKEFVTGAILHAPQLGRGAGPMHHFFQL